MEEWKKKRDSLLDPYDDQVMIASHRGKFSSSVMENTSLAFLAREFDSCIIKIVRAGRIKPVLFLSSFSLYYLVIFSDM